MQLDLTKGSVTKNILLFAVPMICGNLLQQLYNVVDTLIVGQFLGERALAAVGSAYTLLTFITSLFLGMCMGSGAIFSIRYGEKAWEHLRENIFTSFVMISFFAVFINIAVYLLTDPIMHLLSVPSDVYPMMREYLRVIFAGIMATFLYNFFASLLRAVGNSITPLVFLGISAVTNILLDFLFVLHYNRGVSGAAEATVIAQWISGIGSMVYALLKCPQLRPERAQMRIHAAGIKEILGASVLTCLQQSVMNFGILMVQGLINSFGSVVMAAFAAASKIDSFAYMPLQDFGNAFSTFVAQNYGAGEEKRIRKGIRAAVIMMLVFAVVVSSIVFAAAKPLLLLFIHADEVKTLSVGMSYLRIVGVFYFGIGGLFMLYGLYRALN
ncbi:MAG: MATE family efflux transporter, partial [Acetatifactor sp.]|nr:MATE family efflux transporter [Acetatifactor sp.]